MRGLIPFAVDQLPHEPLLSKRLAIDLTVD